MGRLARFLLAALCLAATGVIGGNAAQAHPHVWVTASSELLYAADGTITGVRHSWTFDDMFSTYALQGIETKQKGVYTREELAPLAQTNVESLREYAFFTFAKADGRKQRFNEPVDYYLEYKDSTLVLHFTLPFKTPFKTRELALEVFDPAYFVDFSLAKADPIKLVGAPSGCGVAVERPKGGTAPSAPITEDDFLSGALDNYGAMFANKITVKCL
ncbi:MAG TPA: DUF1007 family protein [Xanthobacteraceae bacterium]|nr:DUF1007 family protein [Xanthobacteraceae bacterium]